MLCNEIASNSMADKFEELLHFQQAEEHEMEKLPGIIRHNYLNFVLSSSRLLA